MKIPRPIVHFASSFIPEIEVCITHVIICETFAKC